MDKSREDYYRRIREEREREKRSESRWQTIHWYARMVAWLCRVVAIVVVVGLIAVASYGRDAFAEASESVPLPVTVIWIIVWIAAEMTYYSAREKTGPID